MHDCISEVALLNFFKNELKKYQRRVFNGFNVQSVGLLEIGNEY